MRSIPLLLCAGLSLCLAAVAYSQTLELKSGNNNNIEVPHVEATVSVISEKPSAPVEKKSLMRVSNKPPPGFESLLEPQTTQVDVYYGGVSILSTFATYTPSGIEFSDTDAILDLIPGVLNRAVVKGVLSQSLTHNAEFVCPPQPYPGCGILEPEVVGVIFNSDYFRVDVFINPVFLERQSLSNQRYLPPSDGGFGFMQLFNLSLSGSLSGAFNSTLAGNTLMSYGSNRLESTWYLNNKSMFKLETLKISRDYQGRRYSVGMLRTQGSRLLGEQNIFGVGVKTTLDTRVDLEQAYGSQLQLYLPLRSRVDIYREGHLLASNFYNTGNQALDTSRLPDGAYEITLRIQDLAGEMREEIRFFSKTPSIPPADQPFYFAQLGVLKENETSDGPIPQYTDNWLVRVGTEHRITDTLGLGAAILSSGKETVFEGNFTFLSSRLRANGGVMASLVNDYGVYVQTHFNFHKLSAGLSYRRIWKGQKNRPNSTDFDPFTQSSQEFSGTLNYHTRYADFGIRANWKSSDQEGSTWAISPGIRVPLYRKQGVQLDFNLDYTQSNEGYQMLGRLDLHGWNGPWSGQGYIGTHSLGTKNARDRTDLTGGASIHWGDGDLLASDLDLTLRADYDRSQTAIGTDVNYRGAMNRMQFAAEHQIRPLGNSVTLYSGNTSFGVASDSKNFALGGAELGQSGIIIDISGSAREGLFDVLVNGQPRGLAKTSKRTLILLPPYDTYEVKLKPLDTGFTSFDAAPKKTTLYPGNVVTMSWEIDQVYVAFGRVLYPDGTPVENARVKGTVELTVIEAAGLLQAEISASTQVLDIHPLKGESCQVQLPELRLEQELMMLGDMVCR